MSRKMQENPETSEPDRSMFTDQWKPDTHEIVIMFDFQPFSDDNEYNLLRGVVRAKCNLLEHDCADSLNLRKCLLLGVDVLAATGASDAPLAPLFFSLFLGDEEENYQIRAAVCGSNNKYPLALASTHSAMYRRKPDVADGENKRRDFGNLDDEQVAAALDATVAKENSVAVPASLLPHIEECFDRSSQKSLEQTHRAKQALSGQVVLDPYEYMRCREKIQHILADVRGGFDDATTLVAELSCNAATVVDDRHLSTQSVICEQPYFVFVKLTVSCVSFPSGITHKPI
jgi:hypothetical protein